MYYTKKTSNKRYIVVHYSAFGGFYLAFLLLLSYALIYGSTRDDPTQYIGGADWLRQACEYAQLSWLLCTLPKKSTNWRSK